mgnify:CR=1 FL=1
MSSENDQISSCPCLRGLVWLAGSCIFVCALLFIALNYDNDVRWIEWIQLLVSSAGAIAIPVAIWWLSSYKNDSEKDIRLHIETLNAILVDLFIVSKNLVHLKRYFSDNIKGLEKCLYILDGPIQRFNLNNYNALLSKYKGFPIVRLMTKFDNRDISFLSRKNADLLLKLRSWDNLILNFNEKILTDKELCLEYQKILNEQYDIITKSGRFPTNGERIQIEKGYVNAVLRNIEGTYHYIEEIIRKTKIIIEILPDFIEKNFGDQVELNSKENRDKYFSEIVELKIDNEK